MVFVLDGKPRFSLRINSQPVTKVSLANQQNSAQYKKVSLKTTDSEALSNKKLWATEKE
jgi:hypothetical protein